jgi:hypothetical protein
MHLAVRMTLGRMVGEPALCVCVVEICNCTLYRADGTTIQSSSGWIVKLNSKNHARSRQCAPTDRLLPQHSSLPFAPHFTSLRPACERPSASPRLVSFAFTSFFFQQHRSRSAFLSTCTLTRSGGGDASQPKNP